MHLYRSIIFILTILSINTVQAQTDTVNKFTGPPKREFRGVWIATVENIDWPKSVTLSTDQQKQQLTTILNAHEQSGLNAVMFQVRPAADAFYSKSTEPWSRWLNGKQGQGPYPFYDPLDFAIEEAHKRGMELHAWFNPYRASNDARYYLLTPEHITNKKPEWFFIYGGKKQFNPGIPEVREYIVQIILNVVDNYNVDGIHMDDYFYPYSIPGQKINDADAYAKYGGDFADIRDWRRNNVDLLIKMLADSIHKHKPNMKFGISPSGIWANKGQNPEGSDTRGGNSYYELYADTRKWIREGWIDYINPQIYWPIGYPAADFTKLIDWWSNNTNNHHLYIGQAAYRINERKVTNFKNANEVPNQIKYLRANPRVQGSVYFSSTSLTDNRLGFTDSLKNNYYKHPALPPVMLWLDSVAPNVPRNLIAGKVVNGRHVALNWEAPLPAADKEPVFGYVVYRFEGNEKVDIGDPRKILHIKYENSPMYVDTTTQQGKTYTYVVTAIDKIKNESEYSAAVVVAIQ